MIDEGTHPSVDAPERTRRCHFHLVKGTERISDEAGAEISDMDHALSQTIATILQVRGNDSIGASYWDDWFLEVTDACGRTIFRVDLGMMGRAFTWVGAPTGPGLGQPPHEPSAGTARPHAS